MRQGGAALLDGRGAGVVKLAARVQRALERLYRIEPLDDVAPFIAPAARGEREALFVREDSSGLRLELRLPEANGLDGVCQVIEGVSHFVCVAERARRDGQTTELELELQAEVDKWVVLVASLGAGESARVRAALFERATFADDARSERGERYRVASSSAHRFVRAVEGKLGDVEGARAALRRFFWSSQEEKLRLAAA